MQISRLEVPFFVILTILLGINFSFNNILRWLINKRLRIFFSKRDINFLECGISFFMLDLIFARWQDSSSNLAGYT